MARMQYIQGYLHREYLLAGSGPVAGPVLPASRGVGGTLRSRWVGHGTTVTLGCYITPSSSAPGGLTSRAQSVDVRRGSPRLTPGEVIPLSSSSCEGAFGGILQPSLKMCLGQLYQRCLGSRYGPELVVSVPKLH